ncbi:hypothetical protein BGX38DRAFT_1231976, partial [Terfezia claveryi]
MTRDDASFRTLLSSCTSQRMPRIWAFSLSSSIQRRIRSGLYFVEAPFKTTARVAVVEGCARVNGGLFLFRGFGSGAVAAGFLPLPFSLDWTGCFLVDSVRFGGGGVAASADSWPFALIHFLLFPGGFGCCLRVCA